MKHVFKSLVLVASVATSLISCQKEQNSPEVKEAFKLTVHAKAENLNGDTKTYINDKQVLWGTGEYMTAALMGEETFATYNSTSESADIWEGESEAMFEFDVTLDEGTYNYGGIYPTSAVVDDNKNATAFKVNLSASQNATAASYDPAAYIMIAKPETFTKITTVWEASFRRATALNKITLTGLEEEISAVEITAPSTSVLAGRRYFNLTTGESGEVYINKSNVITVNYDSPLTADNKDVWFTSWGTTIASGTTLKIKATSSAHTYTRTITAKDSGISFKEGFLNTLTINMAAEDVEIEDISNYSGNYLVVSGEYLLTDYNADKSFYNYIKAAGTELSDFWGIPNVENYVWTVAKLDDGSYSFYNAYSKKYLALTESSNSAHESEETSEYTAMTISKEDDGSLTIYSKKFSSRNLRYNTASPRFAFYGNTTTGNAATLLAYTPDERPNFDAVTLSWDPTNKSVSWTAVEDATNGYEYTTDGGATVTAIDANTIDCSSWTNGEYSVKVRVVGTDSKKISEWSDACEFTISGGEAAKYYRKVTEELADWTGTYLIVAGTSAANSTITSKWLKYITVTADSENKILSEDKTDAVAVSIEETETDGVYTIQFADKKYLGTTKSNDGIKVDDTAGDDFNWTFSFGDGLVKITSTMESGRHLRLNGSSGFRTYTGTTGTQATLYKLDEVAVSSIIVSGSPTKTEYKAGDKFETAGLIATAKFSDASEKDVTAAAGWTITPETLSASTTSVTVVATYKGVESNKFTVNGLSVKELSSISVKTAPTKTIYTEGEKFDPTGLVINMKYSDESTVAVAYSGNEADFNFEPSINTVLTTENTSVTITYSGKSVDQAITVNETPALETMDEIFAAATSTAKDAKVKFGNWVVSGVNGDNVYVTDGSKGLIIYTSNHGFAVGDVLSGTVSCKLLKYNGSSELKEITTATAGLTVTKGGTITPTTIAIADLTGAHTGAVITFESLQYNGSAFSDGTNTITPYNTFKITMPTLTSGKKYTITGIYIQYNSTKEIAPRATNDIVPFTGPYLNAEADKTSIAATGESVTITVDTNVEGWTVASDNTAFVVGDKDGKTVPVVVSENTSTTNGRTAKITVSAEGVDDVVITLTQAKAGGSTTTWTRVTTIAELTTGGTFIMGYEATAKSGVIVPLRSADCNGKTTANGYFNTGTTASTSTNGTIDISKLTESADYEVYISSPASGKINIQMKDKDGSFYGATSGGSTKNLGRLYTSGNSAETNLTPEFSSERDNQFKLTSDVTGQYKYLKYNTSSPRFAYYNSAGSNIVFYKKSN